MAIVSDEGLFADEQSLTLRVANVLPTIAVRGAAVVEEVLPYMLNLGAIVDPGKDLAEVVIDWGDGTPVTRHAAPGSITHVCSRGPAHLPPSSFAYNTMAANPGSEAEPRETPLRQPQTTNQPSSTG